MPRAKNASTPRYIEAAHACDITACPLPGDHRAPRAPNRLQDYIWLCIDHVREYNKAWDYFIGMDSNGIEAFRKEAVTGHRPTWKINGRASYQTEALQESLARMFGDGAVHKKPSIPIPPKLKKALSTFGYDAVPEKEALKKCYKRLVKESHPDLNHGDAEAEERFKQITQAYKILTHFIDKAL